MTETMRDIPGHEGRYAITQEGRVWSRLTLQWRQLYQRRDGYLTVSLRVNGRDHTTKVHRAVALTWIPNPDAGKRHINHRDGNKANNSVTNLEWCTRSENQQHAWSRGLRQVTPALLIAAQTARAKLSEQRELGVAQNPSRKLTAEAVRQIRAASDSCAALAKRHGVSKSNISMIRRGITWQAGGPKLRAA